MPKTFENFNSLEFLLFDTDEREDEPIIKTNNITEILEELKRRKTHNGLNWNLNLLFSIEDGKGNPIMWVDVWHLECFF